MSHMAAAELAAKVRAETEHLVQVHEDGVGYAVHVATEDGTFYLRSASDWEMMRRVVNHPADGPTTTRNPRLVRRTTRSMDRGVQQAVRELQSQGVMQAIPFLSYYVEPVVWLVVERDADRARLAANGEVRDTVIHHLREAGVREDLLREARVTVESQETVDRVFGGSWWAAMK